MEISKQIYRLSDNPIFFMSPNIGIKFNLIKKNPDIINIRFRKNLDLALSREKIEYLPKQKIDDNFLTLVIIDYLNNQKSDILKYLNIDMYTSQMEEKDIFYANAFLAYYYYDNNNYESAEPYLKFALKYIENNEVSDYEKVCIYSLTAYFLKTQCIFINSAESYFIMALDLLEEKDSLAKISLLNSLAYYYHNIEKRDKAILYINNALEMVKSNKYETSAFTTYKNAGIIFTTIGDFEKAKGSFKKAFEFSDNLKDNPEENVKLLNTLGYVEFLKGDFIDSFNNHEKALLSLSNTYVNVTKLLDEAIKTFDNLGNSLKFLGDIDASIYMQLFGKEILERVNSVNRLNEFHNLKKTYRDIAVTYLLYKSDIKNAEFYLNLAEIKSEENEHYINVNKNIILKKLILLNETNEKNEENIFYKTIEELKNKGEDNLYVQIIMLEFLIYYYKLKDDKKALKGALEITQKHNLFNHYNSIFEAICGEKKKNLIINYSNYPLNLIKLLSKEKKEFLIESKKSKNFEIIEEFINDISKGENEEKLFSFAESSLNKHFFSKGFFVIEKYNQKYTLKYFNEKNRDFVDKYKDFFTEHIKKIKGQEIINFIENPFIKSCIVEKIIYKEENLIYYFILFNDKKNDWNFSVEESKIFGILMNNLYLKHKNLIQMEKIKLNAITDYLTEFKNASYYNKVLKKLIEKYKSTGEEFALALIDLNEFKKINDTFGHDVGDITLKYFSKILKEKINKDVEFIRYGGDEFVLLFESKMDIEKELIKTKKYFLKHPLEINNEKISIDFAYGIEFYKGQLETELFKKADNNMYKQKNLKKEKSKS